MLAALLLASALSACQPLAGKHETIAASATPTGNSEPTAAVSPAANREQKLAQFLRQRYGDKATLSGNWLGDLRESENDPQRDKPRQLQQHVCAEQSVVIGAAIHELLAICGELLDAGHAAPGFIDFFVLRDAGETLEVSAENIADAFGSSGRPGTVSIMRLGSDFYGFRVEHGWYGQGYSLESQSLVVPGPKGLVDAGTLRSHIDNNNYYDCNEEDCAGKLFDIDFHLEVDDSDRSARIWPLLVTESGEQCGKPVSRRHRFALDTRTWKYPFTESLQRENCD